MKSRLRIRAAAHGRSTEEEAREILEQALGRESRPKANLAERIRRHIEPLGGVQLATPPRQALRRPPNLAR